MLIGQITLGMLGIVAARVRALRDLGDGGFDRLAHLHREEPSKLVLPFFQDLRGLPHTNAALMKTTRTVYTYCTLGAGQCRIDRGIMQRFESPQHVASRRIY